MDVSITAKDLRGTLPSVVARVRRGAKFTVMYRSRPAFRIVPVEFDEQARAEPDGDPIFGAAAIGRSSDGRAAADHDKDLYGR